MTDLVKYDRIAKVIGILQTNHSAEWPAKSAFPIIFR